MFKIKVTDKFSSAHNLRNYDGKCENLHGHTWKVEITLAGGSLDEQGMLCDFKIAKKYLREITDYLDHQHINKLKPFDKLNPTAENISKFFFDKLKLNLQNIVKVSIWESDNARAIYSND